VTIDLKMTAAAITVSALGLLLAAYGFAMMRRRARLRETAAAIGGVYQHEGWIRPGAIGGPGFTIRIDAPHRKFHTTVTVPAQAPGDYVLDAGFFASPLDWSHVTVSDRPPTEAERGDLGRWLEPGASTHRIHEDRLADAGITRIFVANHTISTTLGGIVTDAARLRRIIDALSRLAGPR